jgi:hypothetical protein
VHPWRAADKLLCRWLSQSRRTICEVAHRANQKGSPEETVICAARLHDHHALALLHPDDGIRHISARSRRHSFGPRLRYGQRSSLRVRRDAVACGPATMSTSELRAIRSATEAGSRSVGWEKTLLDNQVFSIYPAVVSQPIKQHKLGLIEGLPAPMRRFPARAALAKAKTVGAKTQRERDYLDALAEKVSRPPDAMPTSRRRQRMLSICGRTSSRAWAVGKSRFLPMPNRRVSRARARVYRLQRHQCEGLPESATTGKPTRVRNPDTRATLPMNSCVQLARTYAKSTAKRTMVESRMGAVA